jgi:hypothetical protein
MGLASHCAPSAEGARQLRERHGDSSRGATGAEPCSRDGDDEVGEPICRGAEAWSRELLLQLNFLDWAAQDLDEACG